MLVCSIFRVCHAQTRNPPEQRSVHSVFAEDAIDSKFKYSKLAKFMEKWKIVRAVLCHRSWQFGGHDGRGAVS